MTLREVPPRSRARARSDDDRTLISGPERRSPSIRVLLIVVSAIVIFGLVIASLGPLLWLGKAALSTSGDISREPFALWPHGMQWANLAEAWTRVQIGRYLLNTLIVVGGSVVSALVIALTGGYVLAVLRPRYAKVLEIGVLATLFVPGVVSLVSLYLTVLSLPLVNVNLINTYWAVWLPAGVNVVNVLLVRSFFGQLPRELFEAARVDGASTWTVFWRIVLPLSKPIIAVIVLLTAVASWKDFLWPLLALPDATLQPLSVGLYKISSTAETSILMAGMFISVIIPIALFLIFQRQFLRSAGQAGAIKG